MAGDSLSISALERIEETESIKSWKPWNLVCHSVLYSIFHILLKKLKIKIFYFDFEFLKFQDSAETERKWKKKCRENQTLHQLLGIEWHKRSIIFNFPSTLSCGILSVEDVMKYVIITAFCFLIVNTHMNISISENDTITLYFLEENKAHFLRKSKKWLQTLFIIGTE